MLSMKLVPSNKWYALFLCGALLLAAGFFTLNTPSVSMQTLRGRPLVEKDGKLLLWAGGLPESEHAEWFDMTDALVDPRTFNHGLGKDRIASIDDPVFATMDDPRLATLGITEKTRVIGYASEGEAKAYPVRIMDRHEIVNDRYGEVDLAVAW